MIYWLINFIIFFKNSPICSIFVTIDKKNVPGDFKLDINNPSNCTATEFLNNAKLFI